MTTATIEDRIDALDRKLDRLIEAFDSQAVPGEMERLVNSVRPLIELSGVVSELGKPAMGSLSTKLGILEERGYFEFGRNAAEVVDRVVTGFDRSDIAALGDNVVLILEAIRSMTQPEIMHMLQRTARSVKVDEQSFADPPGLMALLKELRRPEARRGLARIISMLDSLAPTQDTQEVYP